MRLTKATPQAIKYACTHYHYSHSVPANPVGYNVYNDNDEWCGVILYAVGATPNIGKPYGIPTGGVLELVRVALNGKQEHTSQAVSMSLKQLKTDVPQCRLVVSFADCDQHHLGTIYQATNWLFVGLMNAHARGGVDYTRKENPSQDYPLAYCYHQRQTAALSADHRGGTALLRQGCGGILHGRKTEIHNAA